MTAIRIRSGAAAALAFAGGILGMPAAPPACAATPPEVARGAHIARLICSACHVVATDQEFPPILSQATPSFVAIANRPGVTADSLRHFITSTHWDADKLPMSMPNPMLTSEETRAVALYILSLRTR
jgi:mono/diheme cytochrome c family protein